MILPEGLAGPIAHYFRLDGIAVMVVVVVMGWWKWPICPYMASAFFVEELLHNP